jgi:hypothetical protein
MSCHDDHMHKSPRNIPRPQCPTHTHTLPVRQQADSCNGTAVRLHNPAPLPIANSHVQQPNVQQRIIAQCQLRIHPTKCEKEQPETRPPTACTQVDGWHQQADAASNRRSHRLIPILVDMPSAGPVAAGDRGMDGSINTHGALNPVVPADWEGNGWSQQLPPSIRRTQYGQCCISCMFGSLSLQQHCLLPSSG